MYKINLRKQEKTQSSSNDWVFSYSDLVNHLLFFIMLV
ncbi:flagellar motor protein MotB [Prevotella melaninogenica]